MKKAQLLAMEKLIKLILGAIVFLIIILYPAMLYASYVRGPDASIKQYTSGLGEETNMLLSDILAKQTGTQETIMPFKITQGYFIQGFSINNPNCNKDSSCICIVSSSEKIYECQNFLNAKLTPVIYPSSGALSADEILNVKIIARKESSASDAKTNLEISFMPLPKTDDNSASQDGTSTTPALGCSNVKPTNPQTTVNSVLAKYSSLIESAAQKNKIPKSILIGVISRESGGRFYELSCSDNNLGCGAAGLGQMMPLVAEHDFGLKVFNPFLGTDKSISSSCSDEYTKRLVAKVIGKTYEELQSVSCIQYRNEYYTIVKTMTPEQLSSALDGDERFIPEKSIESSANLLSRLLIQFKGNENLAVAAYNAGATKVEGVCCKSGACIFDEVCCKGLTTETNEYVPNVIAYADTAKTMG